MGYNSVKGGSALPWLKYSKWPLQNQVAQHTRGVHKNLIIGLHSRVTPYFLCIGELNPFKPFSKISVHTTAP